MSDDPKRAIRKTYGPPPVTVVIEGFMVFPPSAEAAEVEAAVRTGLFTAFPTPEEALDHSGPGRVWKTHQTRVWYEGREGVTLRVSLANEKKEG